ncbi:serine protease inhibitor 42Dd-like [Arctopsyche grandis]|uniref:serine protease inhibitor 42Dd-like n=1 Tax=Arctopsyche grandis TaxID=121162 RepID=UPI00406D9D04
MFSLQLNIHTYILFILHLNMKRNSSYCRIYFFFIGAINLYTVVNSVNNYCFDKNLYLKIFHNTSESLETRYFSAVSNELQEKLLGNPEKQTLSFVISPLWLEFILIVISLGSTGSTLKEINYVTGTQMNKTEKSIMLNCVINNMPNDTNLHIEINNFIFVREDMILTKQFYELATKYANVSIEFVDTNEVTLSSNLNKMIKEKTKRRMREIFDDSDLKGNATSIVIVSSVYYKNKWLYPPTVLKGLWNFTSKENGEPDDQVKMFRMNGYMNFANVEDWDAKIVEIPYTTENISMLIFLPNKINGLLKMEEKIIKHRYIIDYTASLMKKIPVAITLPKFTLESAIILPSKLKRMGIKRLFSPYVRLDDMVKQPKPSITNIVQRVKLWADEGRGAFKDTGDEEFPKPKVILMADHPFFFILKMNGLSMMMGHFSI